jgi:hypothetical protein
MLEKLRGKEGKPKEKLKIDSAEVEVVRRAIKVAFDSLLEEISDLSISKPKQCREMVMNYRNVLMPFLISHAYPELFIDVKVGVTSFLDLLYLDLVQEDKDIPADFTESIVKLSTKLNKLVATKRKVNVLPDDYIEQMEREDWED